MYAKQQRTFQQPKCLHIIACLLFSCLVFVLQWQATLATPIITAATSASTTISINLTQTVTTTMAAAVTRGTSAAASAATTNRRRLRLHEKTSGGGKRRSRVGTRPGGGIGSAAVSPCEHKSLSELIKTSPVILKALGAHIFNHDDDEDLRILHNSNDALLLKWQNEQNKILTSLSTAQKIQQFTSSSSSSPSLSLPLSTSTFHSPGPSLSSSLSSSSATNTADKTTTTQQQKSHQNGNQKQQQTFSDAATNRAAILASLNADAILITLTPETIYKGASLLKMAPSAGEHAATHTTSSSSSSSSGNYNTGGSGANSNGGATGDTNDAGSATSSNSIGGKNGNSANGSSGGCGGTGSGLNSGSITSSEASYLYEGQLNASVQPLSCFDENLLKMLPSDLIIFGKLITINEQQQQQDGLLMDLHGYTASATSTLGQRHQQQHQTKDVLKISINGLHRWSPQFENYIWKHLGWDDWSDFTVCSVACGKGVQQRFRRCLLDNPMVNLNMNFNDDDDEDYDDMDVDADFIIEEEMQLEQEMEEEVQQDNKENDNADGSMTSGDEISKQRSTIVNSNSSGNVQANGVHDNDSVNKFVDKTNDEVPNTIRASATTPKTDHSNDVVLLKTNTLITGNMLHFVTTAQTEIRDENSTTTAEPQVIRIFEGHFNDTFSEQPTISSEGAAARLSTLAMNNEKSFSKQSSLSTPLSLLPLSLSATPLQDKTDVKKFKKRQQKQLKVKRKKHKSAKFYSTMFCEGYNIEQRNCNSFECSDDINDLLKFYRKYPTIDETNTVSAQTMIVDSNTIPGASSASSGTLSLQTTAGASSYASASTMKSELDGTEINNQNINTFTTPINMGYVPNWQNVLNFTIMLTIRVKNDSYTTATIFSIRNSTHNLYLESCKDGLRLYLERDKTTEMLPIKFNLYDYHWHQVAISIQNGDFISIHVDCSWTNSFVVSKRLFSLPVTADVEIGRGFNGELQQLLILPEHQERYQCSEKRISINEVKRYIIDTFIDDYAK